MIEASMVSTVSLLLIAILVHTSQALIEHPVGRFPFLMPNVHPYRVSLITYYKYQSILVKRKEFVTQTLVSFVHASYQLFSAINHCLFNLFFDAKKKNISNEKRAQSLHYLFLSDAKATRIIAK